MENSQILYSTSSEYLSASGFEIRDCGKVMSLKTITVSSGKGRSGPPVKDVPDRSPPSISLIILGKIVLWTKSCASSKVATAGGAIGGRAGTGWHYLCSSIGWCLSTSFRRRELYTSIKDSQ